jgi:uncharacterized membrane protein YeaQ/YmgE (transglycosylase-associated protein family)
MSILVTLIIGLGAGALAKLIMPGKDPGGLFVSMLLGLAGSVVARFLGQALGWYAPGQSAGFFGSTVGAILILLVYRFVKGRKAKAAA